MEYFYESNILEPAINLMIQDKEFDQYDIKV